MEAVPVKVADHDSTLVPTQLGVPSVPSRHCYVNMLMFSLARGLTSK